MGIGDRIIITEELQLIDRNFPKGHVFTIVGSGDRGFDLEDDEGNKVSETRFIHHIFRSISDFRDEKIDEILSKKLGI